MKAATIFALGLFGLGLGGCASVSRQTGYPEVGQMVEQRTGEKTRWDNGTPEDAEVRKRVAELLQGDLSLASAVQIALLHNPSLQADYERLGVAQADLVQAGLLRNPSLDLSVRFPASPGGVTNFGFGLVQSFLDLFLLPLRKRFAEDQFEAAKLTLANQVFEVILQTRDGYYRVQAAQQLVGLRQTVLEAARISAELAQRQHAAGNISEFDAEAQRTLYEQAKLDLARDELASAAQRERLTRAMGLWGPQTTWKVSAPLAPPPAREEPLEHLESIAISQRLDVALSRQEDAILERALDVAQTSRFVGVVDVGISGERSAEGYSVIGPTLRLELPIFDQRQPLIARLEAQQRESKRRLEAVSVLARSEVREARLGLLTQRQVVDQYRQVLIPLREHAVQLAQVQYNAMLLGVYQLLLAKQAEVNTYREYIEAVRDYWLARTALERAAGGTPRKETAP